MNTTMNAKDAVCGSLADCYVTIDGNRYNLMSMTEFESSYAVTITDVKVLGRVGLGHKATGGKGTWSGKAHYNTSVFRKIADTYQKTGVMPTFEIQTSNEDPTSAVGRQTIILHDCLCEKFTLAKFQAGDGILEEDLSGTFDFWDMPEEFTKLAGMR